MAPLFLLLLTFFTGSLSVRYIVSMPVTKAARLHQIVENTDLKIVRAIGPPGFYLVEAPDEDHPHVHSLRGHVDSMEKEVPLRRKTRLVDPSMNDAWYLTGTTHFGSAVPVTLNATQVWSHDKKGRPTTPTRTGSSRRWAAACAMHRRARRHQAELPRRPESLHVRRRDERQPPVL